jgi:hypothetical protein
MGTATYSAKVAAGGTATITIQTRSRVPWVVGQIAIEMANTPSGATCALRKNGAIISPMIAPSDVAAGEPYILLNDTDTLTVEWAGCTPNAIGKATVLFEEKPG